MEIKRLGAIGSGSVFHRFVEGLAEADKEGRYARFTAVADVKTPEDVDEFTANYKYYQLPGQWAANPDADNPPPAMREFLEQVDGIYVATPNNTHNGYILCALRAGKHVICTKPLTHTLSTSQRLQEELGKIEDISLGKGEAGKIKFMYEDHYLYQDISMKLFDELLLKDGEENPFSYRLLGEIQSANGYFVEKRGSSRLERDRACWLFDPEISGGGVWIDIGIHLVTILRKLGAGFEIMSADSRIDPGFKAEMKMTVQAKLKKRADAGEPAIAWNDTPVLLIAEKEAGQARKEINLYFEKGLVSVNFAAGTITRCIEGKEAELITRGPVSPYQNVAAVFVRLITGVADRRLVSLHDAVKDMEVVDEVYNKAKK